MSPGKGPPRDPNLHKYAAVVDGLLEGLYFPDSSKSQAAQSPPKPARRPSRPSAQAPKPGTSQPSALLSSTRTSPKNGRLGTWSRIALGLLLVLGVAQWPYSHACGFQLGAYMAAVGVVILAAVWGGAFAWNNRLAVAHVVSLGVLGWGVALGTGQVLPRVGYAGQSASWGCVVQATPAPTQVALPAQNEPAVAEQGEGPVAAADSI
jgi:hypothetical protein